MQKITTPKKPDEKNYIITEGVNYFETGKKSIWGSEDSGTLNFLRTEKIQGKWLNLAAGDGRYNLILLKKADKVVAADIDESALSKLWHNTLEEHRAKLEIEVFDITKRFPLKDDSFDGVFCIGILHVFPQSIIEKILSEIHRILKPNGKMIIDFATNVKRIKTDGNVYTWQGEPKYDLEQAKEMLAKMLEGFKTEFYEHEVPEETIHAPQGFDYKFSCKFLLVKGTKEN